MLTWTAVLQTTIPLAIRMESELSSLILAGAWIPFCVVVAVAFVVSPPFPHPPWHAASSLVPPSPVTVSRALRGAGDSRVTLLPPNPQVSLTYVKFYQHKREREFGSTLIAVLALTTA